MATITSTASDFNLTSTFTCTTTVQALYVSIGATYTVGYVDKSMSTPTAPSKNLTFTYSSLGGEQVNTAVLTITVGNNPAYGGYIIVNGEQVYARNGVFTYYLDDLSIIGDTSTTLTVQYKTYGEVHDHRSDYDSKTTSQSSPGMASEVVYTTKYKKNHSSAFSATNVQLRILTGSDAESANKIGHIFVGVNDVAKKVKEMYVGVGGKAKRISAAWVGVNGVARKVFPGVSLGEVPVGSLIQIDEMGDGNLVLYRVMGHNHYSQGTTVLMRERLLAKTGSMAASTSNNKNYFGQNMDVYLNTTWRAMINIDLMASLKKTTIGAQNWYAASTCPTAERYIWAPALNEVSAWESSSASYQSEGSRFAYFTANSSASALFAYSDDGSAKAEWWTRSPVFGTQTAKAIDESDTGDPILNREATRSLGYRPVFCLSSDLPAAPLSAGVYDLVL